jgi:hypothetical protein
MSRVPSSLAVGLAIVAAAALASRRALAHPVTVDGNPAEWSTRTSVVADTGILAAATGEFIWTDAAGDARTSVSGAGPETFADMTAVHVTGDATSLYFLVRGVNHQFNAPPQVQIAIDLDGAQNSGALGFLGAETGLYWYGWEYLVQTRFRTGTGTPASGSGAAWLMVPGPNKVADLNAALAVGGAGAEIAVPWSALGLAGPPINARFAVAIFREDASHAPIEVAGSDALDVLTDYGDPYVGPSPGTWAEVSDGVLHDQVQVFFQSPGGDIWQPVVIHRVGRGSNFSFITIRSQTSAVVLRASLRVGDASGPSNPEGMYSLGTGTLGLGATVTLASNGTSFQAALGAAPTLEISDSGAIPNATKYTPWAPGDLNLAWGTGDEVVLLDATHTILDALTWGAGTLPGLADCTDVPQVNQTWAEKTLGEACDANMRVRELCGATLPCSSCGSCGVHACLPNLGATCADGTQCGGTCDDEAECSGGSPLDCGDGNPCTLDFCNFGGTCSHQPFSPGIACPDADPCDGVELCDGAGACVASATPLDCDDENPCTVDSCESGVGCVYQPAGAGTACANGNACDGAEVCDGAGSCPDAALPLDCDDGNPCTVDLCEAGVGCFLQYLEAGSICDDGDACTEADVCDGAGSCQGAPLLCAPAAPYCKDADASATQNRLGCFDSMCQYEDVVTVCASGCDPATGLCNGDPCAGVACDAPPDACHASPGKCEMGRCLYALAEENTPCDDFDPCTVVDRCSAAGACVGVPLQCGDAPRAECLDDSTSRTYDAAGTCVVGACQYDHADQSCALGCDVGAGLCNGDPCSGVACLEPPSPCHQAVGTCDGGACQYALRTPGSSCNEFDPCTVADACDAGGDCAGIEMECNAPPAAECLDANTSRTYDPVGTCTAGACDYAVIDTPCALGCDASTHLCVGDPCAGVTCDEPPGPCFLDVGGCAGGNCSYAARSMGIPCVDGDVCTNGDACDGEGACLGTVDPGCGVDAGVDAGSGADAGVDAGADASVAPDAASGVDATAHEDAATPGGGGRDAASDTPAGSPDASGVTSDGTGNDPVQADGGKGNGDVQASSGGCGCRLAAREGAPDGWWGALVALGIVSRLAGRRRRRA